MNYGSGPTVPTYDYPSQRSLRSSESRSSRGSGRSRDSRDDVCNSTIVETVINYDRNKNTKGVSHRTPYNSHYIKDDDDDDEQASKLHSHPTTSTSSSPDYSETQLEPYSPVAVDSNSTATTASTIALFGATTKTGQAFVRLALDAGYQVRALLGNSKKMEPQPNLSWIVGSLNDKMAIQECVEHVDFVVCTLAEVKFKQNHMLRDFVQRLYPIMNEQGTIQVFLFQSCSLASDLKGKTPVLSQVVKSIAHRGNQSLRDQDTIIPFIHAQHNPDKENNNSHTSSNKKPSFSFLITRPTILIKDGPSIKKLAASKSQPGPFSITHMDLAEFQLNALLNPKLHNTCPYVVADSGL